MTYLFVTARHVLRRGGLVTRFFSHREGFRETPWRSLKITTGLFAKTLATAFSRIPTRGKKTTLGMTLLCHPEEAHFCLRGDLRRHCEGIRFFRIPVAI